MSSNSSSADANEFFSHRAMQVVDPRDRRWLSYVSGRDPELWTDDLYDDLVTSIVDQMELDSNSHLVEIGCAAGFLAAGLAPLVSSYVGLDMSAAALDVLTEMDLPNATVVKADARTLPFEDESCHSVLCYDVITNFALWDDVEAMGSEVSRVLAPGGIWLLGSIPDSDCQSEIEFVARTASLATEDPPTPIRWWKRFGKQSEGAPRPTALQVAPDRGAIACYYFKRAAFVDLAEQNGLSVELADIHAKNRYFGFRFNAIFRKL